MNGTCNFGAGLRGLYQAERANRINSDSFRIRKPCSRNALRSEQSTQLVPECVTDLPTIGLAETVEHQLADVNLDLARGAGDRSANQRKVVPLVIGRLLLFQAFHIDRKL